MNNYKKEFKVGKYHIDTKAGSFTLLPNEYFESLMDFTPTEKDVICYLQYAPPAVKFNISSFAKKIGSDWKSTHKAINRLIQQRIIKVVAINDGVRYCLDFSPIKEKRRNTESKVNHESKDQNSFALEKPSEANNCNSLNASQEKNSMSNTNPNITAKADDAKVESVPIETDQFREASTVQGEYSNYKSLFFNDLASIKNMISNYTNFLSYNPEVNSNLTINDFEVFFVGQFVGSDKEYVPSFTKHDNEELVYNLFRSPMKYTLNKFLSEKLDEIKNRYEGYFNFGKRYQLAI